MYISHRGNNKAFLFFSLAASKISMKWQIPPEGWTSVHPEGGMDLTITARGMNFSSSRGQ